MHNNDQIGLYSYCLQSSQSTHHFKPFQGIQYESVDVKKTSTVDYTCDDMSMDVNKVLYAAVRPHQETVLKDKDEDPSVTSSSCKSTGSYVPNETVLL